MDEDKPKILATFIIEMLGKPADHLKETLSRYIEQLGTENGVNIIEKTFHEPKALKDDKIEEKDEKELNDSLKEDKKLTIGRELFSTFAEVEAEFDNLPSLLMTSFKYMPANIEVTKPGNFILRNSDIGELLSGIIVRLHKYDEIAKKLSIDKAVLESKLKELSEKKD